MPLVSGYDSDSDENDEAGASMPKPTGGLSSLLPPPSAKPSTSLPSGLKLPPAGATASGSSSSTPASQKRAPEKRQIKIESLGSLSAEEDGASAANKKPKLESAGSSSAKSGLHGLLGMLPAPKERPPPVSDTKDAEAVRLNNMGLEAASEGRLQLQPESSSETKKAKGNNDFRAMLGLKSNGNAPKAKVATVDPPKAIIAPVPAAKATLEPIQAPPSQESKETDAKADFFTFSASTSNAGTPLPHATKSISTAPLVEEEEEERPEDEAEDEDGYKGWQQGPDGNWFPVTPEAHAAYNDYLSAQGAQTQTQDRPADMQYGDINTIQSVDANASRAAWLSRPSSEVDSSAAGLDRKYAMAAASMAMPDQGVPLVDQEEEVKKMDKKTNMRARRKGQLSALIAQAEENREKLEERWSRGKEGRNVSKEKYGF